MWLVIFSIFIFVLLSIFIGVLVYESTSTTILPGGTGLNGTCISRNDCNTGLDCSEGVCLYIEGGKCDIDSTSQCMPDLVCLNGKCVSQSTKPTGGVKQSPDDGGCDLCLINYNGICLYNKDCVLSSNEDKSFCASNNVYVNSDGKQACSDFSKGGDICGGGGTSCALQDTGGPLVCNGDSNKQGICRLKDVNGANGDYCNLDLGAKCDDKLICLNGKCQPPTNIEPLGYVGNNNCWVNPDNPPSGQMVFTSPSNSSNIQFCNATRNVIDSNVSYSPSYYFNSSSISSYQIDKLGAEVPKCTQNLDCPPQYACSSGRCTNGSKDSFPYCPGQYSYGKPITTFFLLDPNNLIGQFRQNTQIGIAAYIYKGNTQWELLTNKIPFVSPNGNSNIPLTNDTVASRWNTDVWSSKDTGKLFLYIRNDMAQNVIGYIDGILTLKGDPLGDNGTSNGTPKYILNSKTLSSGIYNDGMEGPRSFTYDTSYPTLDKYIDSNNVSRDILYVTQVVFDNGLYSLLTWVFGLNVEYTITHPYFYIDANNTFASKSVILDIKYWGNLQHDNALLISNFKNLYNDVNNTKISNNFGKYAIVVNFTKRDINNPNKPSIPTMSDDQNFMSDDKDNDRSWFFISIPANYNGAGMTKWDKASFIPMKFTIYTKYGKDKNIPSEMKIAVFGFINYSDSELDPIGKILIWDSKVNGGLRTPAQNGYTRQINGGTYGGSYGGMNGSDVWYEVPGNFSQFSSITYITGDSGDGEIVLVSSEMPGRPKNSQITTQPSIQAPPVVDPNFNPFDPTIAAGGDIFGGGGF